MKTRKQIPAVAALFAAFTLISNLHAQPLVNIETVTVGDAGNAADTTGYGAVTNVFRIGKYEVTIGQYTAFLNSVARTNTNSYIVDLWNPSMATDLNIAGISRSGSGTLRDPYNYSVIGPNGLTPAGASSPGNRPITYVSWFDAARFCNWLHNGATNGASTETGAYTLNGATNGVGFTKNGYANWWIPSEDEWYKAAYYKGGGTNAGYWDYPTQSDTGPAQIIGGATNQANYMTYYAGFGYAVTQSASYSSTQNYLTDAGAFSNSATAYNTFDQGGNVWEWNDAVIGSSRGLRGGSWGSVADYGDGYGGDFTLLSSLRVTETMQASHTGFRVASAPEPSDADDTDGDGVNDSIETHYNTDPNNASVTPNNSRPTGVVSQWVAPEANQSAVPSGLTDVVQIAGGGAGYALINNGTIAAWGEIWSGSGSGVIPAYVPAGLSNVVQVDAGINYVLVLRGFGTLVTWGHFWNGYGHQAAFVPEGLSGVVQISAGISHAAALKADGTIAVWGTNIWGQLDIPDGLADVIQVEAGGYHTMALKSDGTVVVWGGIDSRVRDVPAGLTNVVKIAAGGHVCVALKRDGTVVAWGSDNLGGTDVPVGLTDIVAISASPHVATIALKQDGTAVSWGDKSNIPLASSIIAADAGLDRNILLLADTDNDGIPDAYETNTGVYVSPTDTGTDPNNPDSDGDGLSDGVETATYVYIDATDTGTDPNLPDTDGDGLSDNVETNTGIYASATNTGTSPVLEDTSGDGITDGEAVAAQFNPLIDQRPVLNFLTQAVAAQPNRFGFYNEANVMHLGMGGLMIRKSGSVVNLDLQWQTKNSLTNAWTNHGAPLPFFLNLPGSKAFIRLQATPGAP